MPRSVNIIRGVAIVGILLSLPAAAFVFFTQYAEQPFADWPQDRAELVLASGRFTAGRSLHQAKYGGAFEIDVVEESGIATKFWLSARHITSSILQKEVGERVEVLHTASSRQVLDFKSRGHQLLDFAILASRRSQIMSSIGLLLIAGGVCLATLGMTLFRSRRRLSSA